jgi:hypothetical protein
MMHNAIELAIQRGWKVFPVIHRSRFSMEQPLLAQATTSIEQVEEWQKQFPDCLWAVATGEESGVFAVEFSRDLGIETMRSLCNGDFSAMDTLQIRTTKQVTMFFRWPDHGLPMSRGEQIAEGISIRHSGGYAGLPAEPEESGGKYQYSNPNESPKEAPGWLLNLIDQKSSKDRPADVIPFQPSRTNTRYVALSFVLRDDRWECNFISMYDGGVIVKTLHFRSSKAVQLLIERGGVTMNAPNRKWLYGSLRSGGGNVILPLTGEQYAKLLAA